MNTYELTADIQHENMRNKNLCYTQHFSGHVKAANEDMAMRLAVREVFNKTGFYVGLEKIHLKKI